MPSNPPGPRLLLELQARGVADVLVFLKLGSRRESRQRARMIDLRAGMKRSAASSRCPTISTAAELARHFVSSAASSRGALALALATAPLKLAARRLARRGALHLASSLQRAAMAELPAPARFFPRLGVLLGTVDVRGYEYLAADERVAGVHAAPILQLIRPLHSAVARLTRNIAWGIEAMRVPELWRQRLTGRGVKVGHLDTGVDGRHPALRRAISSFAFFDLMGRPLEPAPRPFDSDWHGTHTAAIIAGRPVKKRYVGVAPGALLASACVIEGGDTLARVLGGMDWAVGQGVRVLSMSLGFPGYWPEMLPLTQILRERGILPVFAVGNEGEGQSRSPGNYDEALSVGAVDRQCQVADFSGSQALTQGYSVPDLVAPGVDIISARPGGGFLSSRGTSMAAPHVAGLAALLLEARPEATVEQLERAILDSCQLGALPPGRAGRGLPDATQALSRLAD
jgi:subtilisin